MAHTNETANYGLSQFTGTDRPSWIDDYNADMGKIDAAIYTASQAGDMTSIEHTADLTGDGTDDSPLGVADTIARTEDIPSLDGYATTESVMQAIAAAIADRLTAGDIKSGNGINIKTSGNQVTISYVGGSSGGLSAVTHDATLTGSGTADVPLGVAAGTMITPSRATYEQVVDFNDITAYGAYDLRAMAGSGNQPTSNGDNVTGGMLVIPGGYNTSAIQIAFIRDQDTMVFIRAYKAYDATWTNWSKIAFTSDIPDVSALTSRIAALESRVAALTADATPSATGLTAKQLDSLYSDGYNIIKVGTPVHSNGSGVVRCKPASD